MSDIKTQASGIGSIHVWCARLVSRAFYVTLNTLRRELTWIYCSRILSKLKRAVCSEFNNCRFLLHLLAVSSSFSTHEKSRPKGAACDVVILDGSTLAGFEPALSFVDHVNAAFATHNTAIAVPVLERAERVLDLHGLSPVLRRLCKVASAWCCGCPGNPKQ